MTFIKGRKLGACILLTSPFPKLGKKKKKKKDFEFVFVAISSHILSLVNG